MEEGFQKNLEHNEYSVHFWRKKFEELKPQLQKNWHGQLVTFDPSFDSLKGANEMRSVSHKKGSLVVTQKVVSQLEKMLSKKRKSNRREKSLIERINTYKPKALRDLENERKQLNERGLSKNR